MTFSRISKTCVEKAQDYGRQKQAQLPTDSQSFSKGVHSERIPFTLSKRYTMVCQSRQIHQSTTKNESRIVAQTFLEIHRKYGLFQVG